MVGCSEVSQTRADWDGNEDSKGLTVSKLSGQKTNEFPIL